MKRALTCLWMIRVLLYELDELLKNSERDARKRGGTRWSLQPFTRMPP